MKTIQTAGRGNPVDFQRKQMHAAYAEARFEASMLRQALPYRSQVMRAVYAAQVRDLHNVARATLRHLNAKKAEAPCVKCAAHYGYDGAPCDEGKPVASPHRKPQVAT